MHLAGELRLRARHGRVESEVARLAAFQLRCQVLLTDGIRGEMLLSLEVLRSHLGRERRLVLVNHMMRNTRSLSSLDGEGPVARRQLVPSVDMPLLAYNHLANIGLCKVTSGRISLVQRRCRLRSQILTGRILTVSCRHELRAGPIRIVLALLLFVEAYAVRLARVRSRQRNLLGLRRHRVKLALGQRETINYLLTARLIMLQYSESFAIKQSSLAWWDSDRLRSRSGHCSHVLLRLILVGTTAEVRCIYVTLSAIGRRDVSSARLVRLEGSPWYSLDSAAITLRSRRVEAHWRNGLQHGLAVRHA